MFIKRARKLHKATYLGFFCLKFNVTIEIKYILII